MNKLYNKIYNAINEGIQKALLIDPDQNDVSINYSYHKINSALSYEAQQMFVKQMINNHDFKNLLEYEQKFDNKIMYTVSGRDELLTLVAQCILIDYKCNLNWIDTSKVTDMSTLFMNITFDGDISKWDVSNVININYMFYGSSFTGDLSQWKFSNENVERVCAFKNCKCKKPHFKNINQLASDRYTARDLEDLKNVIAKAVRSNPNCDLNWIDISNVSNLDGLFKNSKFDGDISKWDVSHVTSMCHMFYHSAFNGNISNWNVSNVERMAYMFAYSDFNQDISKWRFIKTNDMNSMFTHSQFNQDISNWNTENIEYMCGMFSYCPFNQDISGWDVSSVETFYYMFGYNKAFSYDLSNWKIKPKAVTGNMFIGCPAPHPVWYHQKD